MASDQTMWVEHSIQVEVEALQAVQGMPDGEENEKRLSKFVKL